MGILNLWFLGMGMSTARFVCAVRRDWVRMHVRYATHTKMTKMLPRELRLSR